MKFRTLVMLLSVGAIAMNCNQEVQDTQQVPVYRADFVESIKLSHYFEKMEYVFLEESHDGLFMNADVIEYYDNHWYILDEKLKTILCFNQDGSFKFRIHAVGKGPGEYQLPTSMFINKSKSEIWVQCKMSKRLLRYDLEGNFINDFPLGRAGIDMVQFNEQEIISFDQDYHYFSKKDSTYPGLIVLDNDFNQRNQIFEIKYDILLNDLLNNRCLTMLGDSCFFTYASDSLFCISQDKRCHVKGVFNFGKYHLPDRIRSLPRRYSNYDELLDSGKVLWKDALIPHSDYFFLTLGLQNSYWYGIVNRHTTEFTVSQGFINDLQEEPFVFPRTRKSENELVGFMSADYILALQESLSRLNPGQHTDGTRAMQRFANLALERSGNTLVIIKLKT
jgi:hypothetical protein